jgi:tetratricopeptide (TPR) repeat protein
MIAKLHDLVEKVGDPPSNTFTYAALAEMARIAGLSERYAANRGDELPDSILESWLYIADEYYKLGHYLFSQKYFEKAMEAFSKCDGNSVSNDEGLKSKITRGFTNLLDSYNKMGKKEAAEELLAFVREDMPSELEAIQKPKPVFLNTDPVEYTERYMEILPELDAKIEVALSGESPSSDIYCFRYWQEKERLLKLDYGIEWESPFILNPGVMFN